MPAQIVNAALEESVHVVGLFILSGSHVPLVRDIMDRMRAAGLARRSGGAGSGFLATQCEPGSEKAVHAAGVERQRPQVTGG
jgi:ethylmalonyl-CoA mutase